MVDLNKSGLYLGARSGGKSIINKPPAKLTPEQIASAGTEHAHQTALFAWAADNVGTYADLRMMFAIANGEARGDDARTRAIRGNRLRAEGVKKGVSDICLPVPARHLHGLFIELKKPKKGRVADLQNEWRDNLNSYGYLALICYGWIEARDAIVSYLQFKGP